MHKVAIISGPLQGQVGTVIRKYGRDAMDVEFNINGRKGVFPFRDHEVIRVL